MKLSQVATRGNSYRRTRFMRAKTTSISYEPGEFLRSNGHKGYERKHKKFGRTVTPTGYGWATESKPSKITVGVEVNGHHKDVWVDRYFKDNWGRMTAGRVQAIQETLPNELELIENQTYAGKVYYTVADESLDSWLVAAKKAR